MKIPIRFILVAVVLVVMFGAAGQAAQAQPPCAAYHVVKPGDNLFRIGLAYNVAWPVLAQINGIANPNHIYVGQVICYPPGAKPAVPPIIVPLPPAPPPTAVPPPASFFPPPGVYPTIKFNTYVAGPGDTVVISGVNFPGERSVQIFITPWGSNYPSTPSGTATTHTNGTLDAAFTIPFEAGGLTLRGPYLTILVRDPLSGYYGYNTVRNPRP